MTRDERLALLDREVRELPLTTQAELLGLNRSGLYYAVLPSPEEVALKHRIDEIYTDHPIYGSRRITAQLQREGWLINQKAVQRYMREMEIEGIAPQRNHSRASQEHRVFPYLLRGRVIQTPNEVWGVDITYIRLVRGWMYLVAIMDWYSRYVIGWELDTTLEVGFVLQAVRKGLG